MNIAINKVTSLHVLLSVNRKQRTRKSCVDRIWAKFRTTSRFFFRGIARKSCNHTRSSFCKSLGAQYGVPAHVLTRFDEFIGFKKKKRRKTIHRRKKNIHRRKFEKTRKRTIYTSFPMYLCTKLSTKGTVYSSVKNKAVTSGQEVGSNWA